MSPAPIYHANYAPFVQLFSVQRVPTVHLVLEVPKPAPRAHGILIWVQQTLRHVGHVLLGTIVPPPQHPPLMDWTAVRGTIAHPGRAPLTNGPALLGLGALPDLPPRLCARRRPIRTGIQVARARHAPMVSIGLIFGTKTGR